MKPSQAFMTSQVSWSLTFWIGEGFGEAVTAERTLRNTSGSQHLFWMAKTSDGSRSSLEWSFLQIFLSASSSVFLWLRLLFPDFDFDFTFRVPWNTSLECAGAQSLVHGVDSPPSRSHPLLPQQNIPNMFSLQNGHAKKIGFAWLLDMLSTQLSSKLWSLSWWKQAFDIDMFLWIKTMRRPASKKD